jgi:glyoxylase-like metal-dependent hydrolase (beta-lactamase superfamily II)
MDFRIVSIGTLAAHPLWNERAEVRTGHATTTLISAGDVHIIVDPSLPPNVVTARLSEVSPIKPEQVTHVFLTSFEPERRRGLAAFENATWLLSEQEMHGAEAAIGAKLEEAEASDDDELVEFFRKQRAILGRCEVAEDRLAPGVDLFPLPGVTPGSCGLLLSFPGSTVLICGDAVATIEHLQEGKVLQSSVDIEQAQESFREAVEIADALVLGRGNVVMNPLRRVM